MTFEIKRSVTVGTRLQGYLIIILGFYLIWDVHVHTMIITFGMLILIWILN